MKSKYSITYYNKIKKPTTEVSWLKSTLFYALVICFPHPPTPGDSGTYGEITRAITRDYAIITSLGGREITRFSFLCPTPLGTYRGNIGEFLPRRTGTEKKRGAMVMSIFTRAKIFFLVAYSCLLSIQFFFFLYIVVISLTFP